MKKNLLFLLVLALLFVGFYQLNNSRPHKFRWIETFDTYDKQPYGAYVLDEMLRQSWPQGYTCNIQGIDQMYESGELNNKNLLIISNSFDLWEGEFDALLEYVGRGGKALIATYSLDYLLEDTLNIYIQYYYNSFVALPYLQPASTVYFEDDSITTIPHSMLRLSFSPYDEEKTSEYKEVYSVFRNEGKEAVMLRYPIGEGELILCCTPALFTNYCVLNDSINPFIRRSLSLLEGKALVRTEYYEKTSDNSESQSVFRYLLDQESLRWAYYIALITILLLFIFSAKRKQKVIPVVKPPANTTLSFVQTVASLYLRKNNNADIIRKKYIYWADKIKREHAIDIINEEHNMEFYYRFAEKTGMEISTARYLFIELDRIDENTYVSDKEMMGIIKKMNI